MLNEGAQHITAATDATTQGVNVTSTLDPLLEKLRSGDGVGRKRRSSLAIKRLDKLARLSGKSDSFDVISPSSPTRTNANSSITRRSKRNMDTTEGIAEEMNSSPIFNIQEQDEAQ
ncbi:hypothetical protein QCA50_002678 [Cerrena zonata]|uniref:Uncharacterized protein n=1 Tax=Cerrena zonata TaxID=2478898 RepID=A0AAW0GKC6_9APHY